MSNGLDPDQDPVGPDLGSSHLQRLSADDKSCHLQERVKQIHARIQKVLPEGVQFNSDFFFLDDERERVQIPLKVGNHWPTSKMPF